MFASINIYVYLVRIAVRAALDEKGNLHGRNRDSEGIIGRKLHDRLLEKVRFQEDVVYFRGD